MMTLLWKLPGNWGKILVMATLRAKSAVCILGTRGWGQSWVNVNSKGGRRDENRNYLIRFLCFFFISNSIGNKHNPTETLHTYVNFLKTLFKHESLKFQLLPLLRREFGRLFKQCQIPTCVNYRECGLHPVC